MENLKKDGSAFALKQTEVRSGIVIKHIFKKMTQKWKLLWFNNFSLVLTQSYLWLQYSVAYDFCLDISVVFLSLWNFTTLVFIHFHYIEKNVLEYDLNGPFVYYKKKKKKNDTGLGRYEMNKLWQYFYIQLFGWIIPLISINSKLTWPFFLISYVELIYLYI